jgi:hypothetical protein
MSKLFEKVLREASLMDELRYKNSPEGLAADPEYARKREEYLAKKRKTDAKKAAAASERASNKAITFTYNQLAKMVPDGEEPKFVKTRVPNVYDIKIGDKLYKKVSKFGAKIEKFRLVESSSIVESFLQKV